jgi:RNA polymerase sigma factor (sigma-70 family)
MPLPPRHGETAELAGFAPQLHVKAHRLIGPKLRAFVAPSDLLQETLLVAVKKLSVISGRPRRDMLAWLNRIMQYRLLRYLRKHRHELEGTIDVFPAPDPRVSSHPALSRLVLEELRGELLAAIDDLPEPDRTVIVALYKERQAIPEIAGRLGRTDGAVRAIHQRAVKRLRKDLEGRSP